MHLTLIRTPPVLPVTSVTAQQGVPSLALAYLSGAARARGHDVTCIDGIGERLRAYSSFGEEGLLALGLTVEEIVERIPANTDVIGVSCQFSNDWILAQELLRRISAANPGKPIIVGGEHVTGEFETVLQGCPFVAAAVLGEGEETLTETLGALDQHRDLVGVAGLALFRDGKVIRTLPRARIASLDRLPWPDWEGLPLRRYLDAGMGMAAQGLRSMPMLASRGCPYRCTFCSAPGMWDARWQGRPVDDVIREAKTYIERYAVTHLEFYDMSPSINAGWFSALVSRLGELGVTWNFTSGMRSEILTPALLEQLRAAGCYKLTFPVETSAPRLILQLKKKIQPERMLGLVRHSVKQGIIGKVNFIWGIPGQRRRDILRDYGFLVRLALRGLHDATCFAFAPYPGSADFEALKKAGRIPAAEPEYSRFLAFNVYNNPLRMRSWSEHIGHRELSCWTLGGMALFYSMQFLLRPYRVLGLIKNLLLNRPVTMLELALHGLMEKFLRGKQLRSSSP